MTGRSIIRVGMYCIALTSFIHSAVSANLKNSESAAAMNIQKEAAFFERIIWVGDNEPPSQESQELWEILVTMKEQGPEVGIPLLDSFTQRKPNSAWTPSIRANLADHYRNRGGYTRALNHWRKAYPRLKNYSGTFEDRIRGQVTSGLVGLLTRLGRVDELVSIFQQSENDYLDKGPFLQRYRISLEALLSSLKCNRIGFLKDF